uniref:reactive oxygen species modulator 1-like n=1 Tax=Arvicanthis niloticus TaxID=61156 RepID=UPI0014863346|nr:reactive oxygen species modulator 1-like [Arvicanthis niloticus]
MAVATGPERQCQPGCFDHVRVGSVMSCAMAMVARALFCTFSCLRIEVWGWKLMGGTRETLMQGDGTFGTFMATGMGTRC